MGDVGAVTLGAYIAGSTLLNMFLLLRGRARPQVVRFSIEPGKEQDMSPEVTDLIPKITALVQAKDAAEAAATQAAADLETSQAALAPLQAQLDDANAKITQLQADHVDDVAGIEQALTDPPA